MRATQAGSGEQVLNISKQAGTPVHQVIAIAGSIEPPPNGHPFARGDAYRSALAMMPGSFSVGGFRSFVFDAGLEWSIGLQFKPGRRLLAIDAGLRFAAGSA